MWITSVHWITLICVYLEVVKVITSLRGWQFVWREGEKVMKTRAKIARIRAAKVSRFFAPLSPRGSFAQRVTRREGMVGNLMPRSPKCAALSQTSYFRFLFLPFGWGLSTRLVVSIAFLDLSA